MEPKSATDIMAIVASVVEIAIFVCDMLLEGGVVRPFYASRLFLFFFFFKSTLLQAKWRRAKQLHTVVIRLGPGASGEKIVYPIWNT